jgi:hypothetical protein
MGCDIILPLDSVEGTALIAVSAPTSRMNGMLYIGICDLLCQPLTHLSSCIVEIYYWISSLRTAFTTLE